jgi:hypothetical protein
LRWKGLKPYGRPAGDATPRAAWYRAGAPRPIFYARLSSGLRRASHRTDEATAVETFLGALDHPRKPEIVALRRIILGVDSSIREDIKWNAPSFHTTEHFATVTRDMAEVKARGTAFAAILRVWMKHV